MTKAETTQVEKKRRIYLATSWRNEYQPRLVALLREAGHEVYDFRNPNTGGPPTDVSAGFAWSEIDPAWQSWTPEQYVAAMSHPAAERGFAADFNAMQWADTCVVVQPCGPSAALEAGWCAGSGRDLIVHVAGMREPDLMYKVGRVMTTTDQQLLDALAGEAPCSAQRELGAARSGERAATSELAALRARLGEFEALAVTCREYVSIEFGQALDICTDLAALAPEAPR